MKVLKLHWIGDIEVADENKGFYPLVITIRPYEKSVRLGRSNSTNPPHIFFISMINSRMISRHHATIEVRDNGETFEIQDFSINGTFVNFRRVQGRVPLRQDDILCLGHTRGSEIQSGKTVQPFKTDLKFRIALEEDEEAEIREDPRERHVSAASHSTDSSSQQLQQQRMRHDKEKSMRPVNPTLSTHSSREETLLLPKKPLKRPRVSEDIRTKKKIKSEGADVESGKWPAPVEDESDEPDLEVSDDSGVKEEHSSSPCLSGKSSKKKKSSLSNIPPSKQVPQITKKVKNHTIKAEATSSSSMNVSSSSLKRTHDKAHFLNSTSASASSSSNVHHNQTPPVMQPPNSTEGGSGTPAAGSTVERCAAKKHCRQPTGNNIDWVACDYCSKWYHMQCVGFSKMEQDQDFYCKRCIKKSRREKKENFGGAKHLRR